MKAAIIKMLQWAITNMIETNEKVAILSKEIGSLTKEREDIKKYQNGNCRTENTITKFKKIKGSTQYQNEEDRGQNQWPSRKIQ